MAKIKEIFENYNTKKTAKKHGRTFEQQEYRNKLAKKVKDIQHGSDLAKTLLEKEKGNIQYVESLGKGRKAGKDVAKQLIESGQFDYVVNNLDKFEGLALDKEIAEKLIENGELRAVAENLEKFEGLDKEIAEKLIEKGYGKFVAENLEKFKGLDKGVAISLANAGYGDVVTEHPEKFGLKNGK